MNKWKKRLNNENALVRYRAKQFIKIIENAEQIIEFEKELFLELIEKITVLQGKEIIVILLDEIEIECEIE